MTAALWCPCPFWASYRHWCSRAARGGNHAFRLIWDPGDPSWVRYVSVLRAGIEETQSHYATSGGERATKANFKGVVVLVQLTLYATGILSWASWSVQWEGLPQPGRGPKRAKNVHKHRWEPYRGDRRDAGYPCPGARVGQSLGTLYPRRSRSCDGG